MKTRSWAKKLGKSTKTRITGQPVNGSITHTPLTQFLYRQYATEGAGTCRCTYDVQEVEGRGHPKVPVELGEDDALHT